MRCPLLGTSNFLDISHVFACCLDFRYAGTYASLSVLKHSSMLCFIVVIHLLFCHVVPVEHLTLYDLFRFSPLIEY